MSVLHEAPVATPPSTPRAVEAAARPSMRGVELVTARDEAAKLAALTEAGHLVARLPRIASGISNFDIAARGHLREAIEGAIEMALALRGALPSNAALGCSASEMARDQLFRVRALGLRGLAVFVPELRRLTDEDGVLAANDSEVLRVWRTLAEDEPVALVLEDADRTVSLHVPMALDSWLVPTPSLLEPKSVRWPDDSRSIAVAEERVSRLDFDPDELVLDHEASGADGHDAYLDADDDDAIVDQRQPEATAVRHAPDERTDELANDLHEATAYGETRDDLDEDAYDDEPGFTDDDVDPITALLEPDRPTMRDGLRDGAARLAAEHDLEDEDALENDAVMRHDPLAGLHDDLGTATSDELFATLFQGTLPLMPPAQDEPSHDALDEDLRSSVTPSPEALEVEQPRKTRKAPPKGQKLRTTTHRKAMAKVLDDEGDEPAALEDLAAHEENFRRRQVELPLQTSPTMRVDAPELRATTRHFDSATLRTHTLTLSGARGSRPVKQIEQTYVEHYVPLLEAVSAGYVDKEAEKAVTAWRSSFEKSYLESFATIRVTGKRPKMVLDAPEDAVRVGRNVGARSVQLVLVDAMRYGLGSRVSQRLEAQMGDIGAEVERSLLWSALPSVTSIQMQLLSQGPRALREIGAPSERDLTAYRDGTACIPRRERIGQRDLLKLDVVEARLRDSGGPYDSRMDDLADEVADAIVKVAEGLPPKTLLYVFGDHGFHLRSSGETRTPRAEQGGARPEEVLVPAYAWLIGAPA